MTDPKLALDRMLTTIAERMDCDATDLDPPLGEVLDPDALVQVVQADGVDSVAFEYRGRWIEIRDVDRVTVRDPVEA
jgi:hypothetical protein